MSGILEDLLERAAKEAAHLLDYDIRLPLGLKNIPAFPFNVGAVIDTAIGLKHRKNHVEALHQRFTRAYTIGTRTAEAKAFLFGSASSSALTGRLETLGTHLLAKARQGHDSLQGAVMDIVRDGLPGADDVSNTEPLTALQLDEPKQFAIGWTDDQDIYRQSLPRLDAFAKVLTSREEASAQFWPTIANHGHAYNLLILKKMSDADYEDARNVFSQVWQPELSGLDRDRLYAIDLRLVGSVKVVEGAKDLFTPATLTLLLRDPDAKTFTPVAVHVANPKTGAAMSFTRGNSRDAAWIYALAAARTSATIWGIAIGHVYHWHLATAALFMTWRKAVPGEHPLHRLIAPHAKHTVGFDDVLIMLWGRIVPPMSIGSGWAFLQLADRFAAGRTFFHDDPPATLARLALREAEFTRDEPWDLYPVVHYQMRVWSGVEDYVRAFVEHHYPGDGEVAGDAALQAWARSSADPGDGNIVGLGAIVTKGALSRFLVSLLFRIVMHGISRVNETAYPALSFVPNYPTCLNGQDIPSPLSTEDHIRILDRLPHTGQIGQILSFYDIFVFTKPYEPFVPAGGDAGGPFSGEPGHPCHEALQKLQGVVSRVIADYQKLHIADPAQQQQWPWCIEL